MSRSLRGNLRLAVFAIVAAILSAGCSSEPAPPSSAEAEKIISGAFPAPEHEFRNFKLGRCVLAGREPTAFLCSISYELVALSGLSKVILSNKDGYRMTNCEVRFEDGANGWDAIQPLFNRGCTEPIVAPDLDKTVGPTAGDYWDSELRSYAHQKYGDPLVQKCVEASGKPVVEALDDCDTKVNYKVLPPILSPIMDVFINCAGGSDNRGWPKTCADSARAAIDKAPVPGL